MIGNLRPGAPPPVRVSAASAPVRVRAARGADGPVRAGAAARRWLPHALVDAEFRHGRPRARRGPAGGCFPALRFGSEGRVNYSDPSRRRWRGAVIVANPLTARCARSDCRHPVDHEVRPPATTCRTARRSGSPCCRVCSTPTAARSPRRPNVPRPVHDMFGPAARRRDLPGPVARRCRLQPRPARRRAQARGYEGQPRLPSSRRAHCRHPAAAGIEPFRLTRKRRAYDATAAAVGRCG